jgi:hypothetical protein
MAHPTTVGNHNGPYRRAADPHDPLVVTILTTRGPLATKRVELTADGIVIHGYDRARWFETMVIKVDGLEGLHALLARLDREQRRLVIRAALLLGIDPRRCRRLLHADRETGDPACFEDVPRVWVPFDFDSVEAPACTDPRDGVDAGLFLRDRLPEPFRDAACLVQATSGCGIKPGLRYRLWFILDRPLFGHEVAAWTASPHLDPATLRPVEPIYTARPVFVDMADPMPRRLWRLSGLTEAVEVPEVLPRPEHGPARLGDGETSDVQSFADRLATMGDGEGLRRFRGPVIGAIGAYARQHGAEALLATAEGVKARIRAAIVAAPKGQGRGADLERYGSDRHLDEIIRWTAAQEQRRGAAEQAGRIAAAVIGGAA